MTNYKIVSWIAVLSWMAVIFYLSHQPGSASSNLSSGVVTALLNLINLMTPQVELDVEKFHTFVRKNAHFFAYLMLGLLSLNAWRSSGFSGLKQLILGFGMCVLFATTDEIHQLFIEGRSGEISDVMIDSAGAALGVLIYGTIGYLWDSKKEKTLKRK